MKLFWNKYCDLSFLAILCSQFLLLIFFALSWYQKTKVTLWRTLRNKKKSCEQKDLLKKKSVIKQPVTKQSPIFLSFFSHWLLYERYFSFLIKAFVDFEKLINFHRQAFIVYKNGEKLKILKEIFRQKTYIF